MVKPTRIAYVAPTADAHSDSGSGSGEEKSRKGSTFTKSLRRRLSLDRTSSRSRDIDERCELLASRNSSLRDELETVKEERSKLQANLSDSLMTINRVTATCEDFKVARDKAQEELESTELQLKDVSMDNATLRARLDASVVEMEAMRSEMKLMARQIEEAKRERMEFDKKLSKLTRSWFRFGSRRTSLECAPSSNINGGRHMGRASLDATPATAFQWYDRFCGVAQ